MTQPATGLILMVTLLLVLVSVTVAADTLTITARQAVVRAGPDSKQGILVTVPQGATFALLETRKGWYKVLLDNGREGWVAQSAAQAQDSRGFAIAPTAAAAPGRTALVIGNAAYSEDIGSLKNPGNDATDMAATLRQLGFVVTLVKDATHQRMAEAVEDFSRQLLPGSVGVFYYAGHGAQVGGRNYLIPLEARITTEAVVPYQAVAAEEVLARMDAAGSGQVAQRHDPRCLPQCPLHAWLALAAARSGADAGHRRVAGGLCHFAWCRRRRWHGPQWHLYTASVAVHDGTESACRIDVQTGTVGSRAGDERAADSVGAVVPTGEFFVQSRCWWDHEYARGEYACRCDAS